MVTLPHSERQTQDRVIALFLDKLGWRFIGSRQETANSNIEEFLLRPWLEKRGHTSAQIKRALHTLRTEAHNPSRDLYDNNKIVYSLLRYGVDVKTAAGKATAKVHLIDWNNPEANDFVLAEEVTLKGGHERRPDLVLYINGIAIGVIELKRGSKEIGEGVRQLLSNQTREFNEWFFSTVQIVFAGNNSEGLRYGAIRTPEKYFLTWKEDEADNTGYKLDKYLQKICAKTRLIELLHDFVLFDGGIKKLPRVHQYFGVKAAQKFVSRREGGIIWHTQGSGKSIVMVLLARWILENNPGARVAIITDREELDKQIEGIFGQAGEKIERSRSGRELLAQLARPAPRLFCSLVHKFGRRNVADFEGFIEGLKASPVQTAGDIFVFVDECHRTQSGKLHRLMKAMMPNATLIGFTGTPLLKKDKTSVEAFGKYIHTYKFDEAVGDGVVLDLVYEARDIDQRIRSGERIDAWFEAKTKGLNQWQKAELQRQWVTMQNVLSSKARIDRVVADIIFDFCTRPRLRDERGNAILVASSIYEATKYFSLFQKTVFKDKCAIVTSYNPQAGDVIREETGAGTETDKQFIYNTYIELLKNIAPRPGRNPAESYEDDMRKLFTKDPARMKLLVVVDKLLTGFDAPPCTCLYIDKSMQDHGLFQAICRTNRLDGDDKLFGCIVDYKDLFKKVKNAIAVYTSELDDGAGGGSPEILLKNRLEKGRERLDAAIEQLDLLCQPVLLPKSDLEYIHYFCGNTENPDDLKEHEPQRVALYKAVVALIRAYANIADDLKAAGYDGAGITRIKSLLNHYLAIRETIRKASGETLDLKPFEADMRHLIDTYIEADEPRKISPFDNITLLELIVETGIAAAIKSGLGDLENNKDAVAETIENNVRRKIMTEHLNDPAFYDTMSAQLRELIELRKQRAIEYEEYLRRIADLVGTVQAGHAAGLAGPLKDSPALRALYNDLKKHGAETNDDAVLQLAQKLDTTIRQVKPDGFRGVPAKENIIKQALSEILNDDTAVERVFAIIAAQTEY
jgi:type I restriction enzyme R subunit